MNKEKKVFVKAKPEQPDATIYLITEYDKITKKGRWSFTFIQKELNVVGCKDNLVSQDETDLYAVLNILEFIDQYNNIMFYTHSIYIKCCLNEWLYKWAKHNFEIEEDCLGSNKRPYYMLLEKIYNVLKTKKYRVREIQNPSNCLVVNTRKYLKKVE